MAIDAPDPASALPVAAPATGAPRRRRAAMPSAVGAVHLLLAALVVAYIALDSIGVTWSWLGGWGVDAFEVVVGVVCMARARQLRRGRVVPALLGTSILLWAAGDIAQTIQSLGGARAPSPWVSDGFYLLFYPVNYCALMLWLRASVRRVQLATWLDAAVVGLGAATVCATFLFHGVLRDAGGSPLSVAVNLAFPVGDVLLLGLVVGCAAIVPGRGKAPWLLLAAANGVNAIGDLFNALGSTSHVAEVCNDAAWPVAVLLISVAVWIRPSGRRQELTEEPSGVIAPAVAAAAALLILLVGAIDHVGHVSVSLAVATLITAGGRCAISLVGLRALTEQRRREAITDSLTGLGNRRALYGLLDSVAAELARDGAAVSSLAFLFLDLNRFKQVNDRFGHAAGDQLLAQAGERLRSALRPSDVVVRLGGDEFAVALFDADADYAATVAGRLAAEIERPFALDAVRAQLGAAIGIAVLPDDASTAAELVRRADRAMYRAKLAGDPFAVYRRDLDGESNRLQLVDELRLAIERRQLTLHYQPQLDLASGEVRSFEALARWPHPRLGFVAPPEFVALAEDAGMIGALTAFVLDEALSQCATWRAAGRQVSVSVNISTSNLLDPDFPTLVTTLLGRHRLTADALVLEITETTAIADFARSQAAVGELQARGLIVSVDDFGAGFTSLAYLGSLAVGELKLDRSFIRELSEPDADRTIALVRATIELAHALSLRVVGEGVEDERCLELLARLGCDLAQGYLISRPTPAAELDFPQSSAAPRRRSSTTDARNGCAASVQSMLVSSATPRR